MTNFCKPMLLTTLLAVAAAGAAQAQMPNNQDLFDRRQTLTPVNARQYRQTVRQPEARRPQATPANNREQRQLDNTNLYLRTNGAWTNGYDQHSAPYNRPMQARPHNDRTGR